MSLYQFCLLQWGDAIQYDHRLMLMCLTSILRPGSDLYDRLNYYNAFCNYRHYLYVVYTCVLCCRRTRTAPVYRPAAPS